MTHIRLNRTDFERSGSVLAEDFVNSIQFFRITDASSGTMSLQKSQFIRRYLALFVEICQKHFLDVTGRECDSLFLVAIAVAFRVDDLRVNSLCVFRLLQNDHADSLTADVPIRSCVEGFAMTVSGQYT